VTGEARVRGVAIDDFPTDAAGTPAGRSPWLESRVIVGGSYRPLDELKIVAELEALNGPFVGGTTPLGTARGDDTFEFSRSERFGGSVILPRKLFADLDVGVGRLLVGQQAFDWGLGILANDGVGDPEFGDMQRGNLVERVAFATRPFSRLDDAPEALRNTTVFLGGDLVFRDEAASLLAGDLAAASILGVRVPAERFELGLLGVARSQRDRVDPADGREPTTTVGVFDATLRAWLVPPGKDVSLAFESELALIAGSTTRPYLEETYENGASVLSFGAVGRLRYDHAKARTTVKLELGYASGDSDPRDDVARQFAFHSDYNVGLILFDQVLPMLSARAIDRIVDPALLATPPSATRHLAYQGGVANALYLFPTVRIRPLEPLDLRVGYLLAMTAADLVDPYSSAKNGGFNTTFGGASPGSRVLGQEVLASARYGFDLGEGVALRVGAEGSAFLPGRALDGIGDGLAIGLGRLLADVRF
jgi:hypothetical protein